MKCKPPPLFIVIILILLSCHGKNQIELNVVNNITIDEELITIGRSYHETILNDSLVALVVNEGLLVVYNYKTGKLFNSFQKESLPLESILEEQIQPYFPGSDAKIFQDMGNGSFKYFTINNFQLNPLDKKFYLHCSLALEHKATSTVVQQKYSNSIIDSMDLSNQIFIERHPLWVILDQDLNLLDALYLKDLDNKPLKENVYADFRTGLFFFNHSLYAQNLLTLSDTLPLISKFSLTKLGPVYESMSKLNFPSSLITIKNNNLIGTKGTFKTLNDKPYYSDGHYIYDLISEQKVFKELPINRELDIFWDFALVSSHPNLLMHIYYLNRYSKDKTKKFYELRIYDMKKKKNIFIQKLGMAKQTRIAGFYNDTVVLITTKGEHKYFETYKVVAK